MVTGTVTGVGKTIATAALAATAPAGRGRGKPVQTGIADGDPDAREVERLTGRAVQEWTALDEPLAPDTAARRQGVEIPPVAEYVERIARPRRPRRPCIVEGAGGLLVRLDTDGGTLLDLAAALAAYGPTVEVVVVVVAPGLGTLNHTELTVGALRARGLEPAGLVDRLLAGRARARRAVQPRGPAAGDRRCPCSPCSPRARDRSTARSSSPRRRAGSRRYRATSLRAARGRQRATSDRRSIALDGGPAERYRRIACRVRRPGRAATRAATSTGWTPGRSIRTIVGRSTRWERRGIIGLVAGHGVVEASTRSRSTPVGSGVTQTRCRLPGLRVVIYLVRDGRIVRSGSSRTKLGLEPADASDGCSPARTPAVRPEARRSPRRRAGQLASVDGAQEPDVASSSATRSARRRRRQAVVDLPRSLRTPSSAADAWLPAVRLP